MHHVIQVNLFNEFGFKQLLDALNENGCPYTVVKVIPFAHTLEPEVEFSPDEKVMVWGSLTLDGIAKERGWKPGVFHNEKFDMRYFHKRFGAHFLNFDAKFCTFGELDFKTPMFCRPVHDTKTFSGAVISPEELTEWKARVLDLSNTGYCSLTPDTPVMYAEPKEIDLEGRFFIVDNVVVSGSSYRTFGKQVMYQTIDSNNPVFNPMLQFVKDMLYVDFSSGYDSAIGYAEPIDKAFVLDVAKVGDQFKVIEINTLNSSGFYATNMKAVVRALENL